MKPFSRLYGFDERPTSFEVDHVRAAIEVIKSGVSALGFGPHLQNSNSFIVDEIAHQRPKDDKKNIGRVVYLSRAVIDEEDMALQGFERMTVPRAVNLDALAKTSTVTLDFISTSILGSSTIRVKSHLLPDGRVGYFPPRNRTRGYLSTNMLEKFYKIIA